MTHYNHEREKVKGEGADDGGSSRGTAAQVRIFGYLTITLPNPSHRGRGYDVLPLDHKSPPLPLSLSLKGRGVGVRVISFERAGVRGIFR
jgi:hypothetical protein